MRKRRRSPPCCCARRWKSPAATAALITPDAALARRVSARLTRWGLAAESSAGRPLAGAPVAVLAALAARAVVDPVDPVVLLAIAKHPLTRLALDDGDLVALASRPGAERAARPPPRRLGHACSPDWSGQPAGLDVAHRLHAVTPSIAAAPYADGVAAPARRRNRAWPEADGGAGRRWRG